MAAAVAVAVLVSGCGSAASFVAALDELDLPDTWERTDREAITRGDDGCSLMSGAACPRAVDRYLVNEVARDAHAQATSAIEAVGLEITISRDTCTHPETACRVTGMDDDRLISVVIEVRDDPVTARVTSHRPTDEPPGPTGARGIPVARVEE